MSVHTTITSHIMALVPKIVRARARIEAPVSTMMLAPCKVGVNRELKFERALWPWTTLDGKMFTGTCSQVSLVRPSAQKAAPERLTMVPYGYHLKSLT